MTNSLVVFAAENMPFPIHFLLLVQSLPAPSFTEGSSNATGFYLQQIAEFSGGEMFVGQIENKTKIRAKERYFEPKG